MVFLSYYQRPSEALEILNEGIDYSLPYYVIKLDTMLVLHELYRDLLEDYYDCSQKKCMKTQMKESQEYFDGLLTLILHVVIY